VAPARAGEILAAVEHAVFHPTRRDMVLAGGVGAGRVAGDQVVDLEPVFDGADSVFEAPMDAHVSLPHIASITGANCEKGHCPRPFVIRHPLVRSPRGRWRFHRRGMTSPIAPTSWAEKNSRPSGIATMARAPQPSTGIAYSPITLPSGAMRPILLEKFSV